MFLKAVFVPQPERMDDTSYFVSRYNSIGMEIGETSVDSDSDSYELPGNSGLEVNSLAHNCFSIILAENPLALILLTFMWQLIYCLFLAIGGNSMWIIYSILILEK